MNKYLVEFIGTFFLLAIIGLVVIPPGAGDLIPVAIALGLTALIYAGGHVSGAHYNPAVTIAFYMCGKMEARDITPYIIAQLLGGSSGAFIALYLKGSPTVEVATPEAIPALVAEFLFTFALCFVILNVAIAKGTENNSFYGLAIGFIVLAGVYSVGAISGGVFNPAVALGITLVGLSALENIWIFLAANFAGAAAAALIFKFTDAKE